MNSKSDKQHKEKNTLKNIFVKEKNNNNFFSSSLELNKKSSTKKNLINFFLKK